MCAKIITGGGADRVTYDGPNYYPFTYRKTFAAWVLRTTNPDPNLYRIAGDSDSAGGNRWVWGSNNNGGQAPFPGLRLYVYAAGGTYQRGHIIPYPSLNVWHHLCFTLDQTSMATAPTIYVDGAAVGASVVDGGTAAVSTATMALRLGNNGSGTNGWPGQIQNEAYWDDILSLAEIQALAKGVNPHRIRPTRLVFHYPMLVGGGEADWASGRAGVAVGASMTPALVPSGPLIVV